MNYSHFWIVGLTRIRWVKMSTGVSGPRRSLDACEHSCECSDMLCQTRLETVAECHRLQLTRTSRRTLNRRPKSPLGDVYTQESD